MKKLVLFVLFSTSLSLFAADDVVSRPIRWAVHKPESHSVPCIPTQLRFTSSHHSQMKGVSALDMREENDRSPLRNRVYLEKRDVVECSHQIEEHVEKLGNIQGTVDDCEIVLRELRLVFDKGGFKYTVCRKANGSITIEIDNQQIEISPESVRKKFFSALEKDNYLLEAGECPSTR